MNDASRLNDWMGFVEIFNNANHGRPTRVGVYVGEPGTMPDYWLEDGLPLQGVDIDPDHNGSNTVEIVLGGNGKPTSRNFTHVVENPRLLKFTLSATGASDGLEIDDAEGNTTIIQFEQD